MIRKPKQQYEQNMDDIKSAWKKKKKIKDDKVKPSLGMIRMLKTPPRNGKIKTKAKGINYTNMIFAKFTNSSKLYF